MTEVIGSICKSHGSMIFLNNYTNSEHSLSFEEDTAASDSRAVSHMKKIINDI
jgi:hypothetical protein